MKKRFFYNGYCIAAIAFVAAFAFFLFAYPYHLMHREQLDLLRYDINAFMEEYLPEKIDAQIYHEAVLIYLAQFGRLTDKDAVEYGISPLLLDKMDSFARFPERYKNSYWYYFLTD